MEINYDLYKIIHLPNGNILLKLKNDVDNTPYNLDLSNSSFYKACNKNIGKINIYEPSNLTHQLINFLMNKTNKIKSIKNYLTSIKWLQDNIPAELKPSMIEQNNEIKIKIDSYAKNNKNKLKSSTLRYLYIKLVSILSGHYSSFGEEFFLLKLLYKYYSSIKWDYKQIYLIETGNDIEMCEEKGDRYYSLVKSLINGDKKAFDGMEIEFFEDTYEVNKHDFSDEIYSYIKNNLYDSKNYKNYDPISY
jgi:hypothetical protein